MLGLAHVSRQKAPLCRMISHRHSITQTWQKRKAAGGTRGESYIGKIILRRYHRRLILAQVTMASADFCCCMRRRVCPARLQISTILILSVTISIRPVCDQSIHPKSDLTTNRRPFHPLKPCLYGSGVCRCAEQRMLTHTRAALEPMVTA